MNGEILKYIIVCPLLFLAGFVDSIAGGGGLISLPAYLIAGLPSHCAIATNKLSSAIGTSVSTANYIRSGFVNWRIAILCVVTAFIGSSIGAHFSLMIKESVLKTIMLFLIPVSAVVVMKSKALISEKEELGRGKTLLIAVISALIIGAYDGFYGPGTGTFLLLSLTVFARLKLTTANGVTKVINLTSNVAALTVFLINGQGMIPLGIAAGVCNGAGNWLGSQKFISDGVKIVKPIMLSVLAVFFIKVIYELLTS